MHVLVYGTFRSLEDSKGKHCPPNAHGGRDIFGSEMPLAGLAKTSNLVASGC